MTEKELCDGCKAGEREAFRQLYYSYAPFLIHLIQRYVGDMDTAKDLLHDSFLAIYDKIRQFEYRGEGSLKAWLSRLCLNNSLMWLRQKQRITFLSLDEARDSDDVDTLDAPGEEAIEGISEETLHQFIQELPDGYRMVFNLYVFEEKSHKEIGQLLGINEKSSSSQLTRAKKMLATKITDWQRKNA
ncbi:MAG: sigma-70 family RNA polymerase sigma factor [Bacteroidales bacterium]|nr:sigma-70 family RNA polymerase sigma factor [Porphyromonas sp.]MDD6934928.1 sigma-70 family RNA polymerase sigma factor [Bacteroidales bacterium]MDY3102120.1 sigma-70 family RNA polymerase sigma factor [Porphyromonas sp.]